MQNRSRGGGGSRAIKLGLDGTLDVPVKVRPEKPKPGKCINLWVEGKQRTTGFEFPECRSQALLNTRLSSTVIRMLWRRYSAQVDTKYSRWNKPGSSRHSSSPHWNAPTRIVA